MIAYELAVLIIGFGLMEFPQFPYPNATECKAAIEELRAALPEAEIFASCSVAGIDI